MSTTSLNFEGIKARQHGTWASGDYALVGTTLQIVGERLCESLDLRSGACVLDVAAGNGNATLAAARRFASVTSTDYVPSLLEAGRARAEAERLPIRFLEADAENLPFADDSFDVALSTFGVMFTPDQDRAASELLRVIRPGGKIGLANWTPEGCIGQLFKIIGKYVPPAEGLRSPALWGTQARLQELFGRRAKVQTRTRYFNFRYHSPRHFIDFFRAFYGPMKKTFAALESDPDTLAAFAQELSELVERGNRSGDGTLVLPGEYLEAVIEKP